MGQLLHCPTRQEALRALINSSSGFDIENEGAIEKCAERLANDQDQTAREVYECAVTGEAFVGTWDEVMKMVWKGVGVMEYIRDHIIFGRLVAGMELG